MIRHVVIAFAAAAVLCATTSSFAAEALTSNIPPFSIEQGPRVGFVREACAFRSDAGENALALEMALLEDEACLRASLLEDRLDDGVQGHVEGTPIKSCRSAGRR